MPSSRNLLGVAVAVAFVAGLLRGTRMLLPVALAYGGGTVESVSTIVSVLTVVLLLIDPVAMLVLGYLWGRRADVPTGFLRFGGRLLVAAFVGFVIGYGAIAVSLEGPARSVLARTAVTSLVAGVKTATSVALAGLAASALAHFRGRYRPGPDERRSST